MAIEIERKFLLASAAWLGEEATEQPRYRSFIRARAPFSTRPPAAAAAAPAGRHAAAAAGVVP